MQLFIKSELAIHSLRAKHSKSSDKCIARTAVQIGYARCCAIMGGSPRKVTPPASHLSSQPRHPATGTFISQHPACSIPATVMSLLSNLEILNIYNTIQYNIIDGNNV